MSHPHARERRYLCGILKCLMNQIIKHQGMRSMPAPSVSFHGLVIYFYIAFYIQICFQGGLELEQAGCHGNFKNIDLEWHRGNGYFSYQSNHLKQGWAKFFYHLDDSIMRSPGPGSPLHIFGYVNMVITPVAGVSVF